MPVSPIMKILLAILTVTMLLLILLLEAKISDIRDLVKRARGAVFYHRSFVQNYQSVQAKSELLIQSHRRRPKCYLKPIPTEEMRLGNLMFVYASTLGIAHSANRILVMQKTSPLFQYFNITTTKMEIDSCSTTVKSACISRFIRMFRPDIVAEVTESEHVCLKIASSLQSFKYFENIYDKIAQEFQFKQWIHNRAKYVMLTSVIRKLIYDGDPKPNISALTLVGIHIRRGDYLEPKIKSAGLVVADDNYIERAVTHLESLLPNTTRQSIVYLILGSDTSYNKKLGSNLSNRTVVTPPQQDAIVDFCLLTLTDHMIMTVGTFGWWAAYLGRGMKIYFNNSAMPGSTYAANTAYEDHFPSEWIGVD